MKPWINAAAVLVAAAFVAGCGTLVRSTVTAFHEWPEKLPENTYVFERTEQENASLEYRSYENLVRAALNGIGLQEAGPDAKPYLKVDLGYGEQVRDVREIYPVAMQPGWYSPAWRFHRFHSPFYDPFYDPFWYGPGYVEMREANYQVYTRRLDIHISRYADGKPLYQTQVVSEGQQPLAQIMPYMVYSAFKDFPGPSGVARQVEVRIR